MHFRICKIIATGGLLTALECTKFVSAGIRPWTSLVGLTALPHTPSWFMGSTSRGGEGKEKGRGKEEEDRETTEEGRGS